MTPKNNMKNKLTLAALACAVSLGLFGCSAGFNNLGKSIAGLSAGDYRVTVWSGGKAVATYDVKNSFVNTEEGTDGWFFFVNGKLVRVSGTVTIEQQ